jgi:copper chaperone CopZ
MCSKAIYNALIKLNFIEEVQADIKTSVFNIRFKQGSTINMDAMKKAVEDAGFSVASLKLSRNFESLSVENDKHTTIDGQVFHFVGIQPQMLNGEQQLQLVDPSFLSEKAFKKYSNATKMACIKTGKAGDCCVKEGIALQTRVYHVTI